MCKWISVKKETPDYGEAVLLSWNGIIQKVIYILERGDDGDFFVDYHQEYDGMYLDVAVDGDAHWMALSSLPAIPK